MSIVMTLMPKILWIGAGIFIVGYICKKQPQKLEQYRTGAALLGILFLAVVLIEVLDPINYIIAMMLVGLFMFLQTLQRLRTSPKLFFWVYFVLSLVGTPVAIFVFFIVLFSGNILWPYVLTSLFGLAAWFLISWIKPLSRFPHIRKLVLMNIVVACLVIYAAKHNPYVYGHTGYTKYKIHGRKAHRGNELNEVMLSYQKLFVYRLQYDYKGIKSVEILYIRREPEDAFSDHNQFTGQALVNGKYYVNFDFTLPLNHDQRDRNDYEESGDGISGMIISKELNQELPISKKEGHVFTLKDINKKGVKTALKSIKITYYKKSDTFRIYNEKRDDQSS